MARYSAFLGRRVEVQYRAGDVLLPASGTFVADSGRSIFLEQHIEQRGQLKHFRWEIPYQYLVRIQEKMDSNFANTPNTFPSKVTASSPSASPDSDSQSDPNRGIAAANTLENGSSPLLPLRHRPKPA